jgi:hypothetical protein
MIDFSGTYLFSESSTYEGVSDSYELTLTATNFFQYSGYLHVISKPFESVTPGENEKQVWNVSGRNMGNLMEIHVMGHGKYLLSKTEKGINWAFTGRPEDWNS